MRIDAIVNTTARRYREAPAEAQPRRSEAPAEAQPRRSAAPALLDRVARVCRGAAELHPTSSLADLGDVCQRIAGRGADLVVLSGGDGSFMAGVTALAAAFGDEPLPPLALIPGGTVATVARNWGMTGDPAALLERILGEVGSLRRSADLHRRTMRRPTLRVRAVTSGRTEDRVGFIFGSGLVAKFFDVYYSGGSEGYGHAARIVGRVFFESFYGGAYARRVLDPLPCRVEVEGRPLTPHAWSLICAAVVRDLGIHMHVTYRAGEDYARPHLVASPLPARQLGPRAPLVLAGRRIGGRDHFDDLVREFTVRFGAASIEPTQAEGPYVLDGDMLRAREVHVSAGPPIHVLLPPTE